MRKKIIIVEVEEGDQASERAIILFQRSTSYIKKATRKRMYFTKKKSKRLN